MATVPRARLFRFLNVVLFPAIASLAMAGCMRTSQGVSDLDAIMRPPAGSTNTRVPEPATPAAPVTATTTIDNSWYQPRSTWSAQAIDLSKIDPMQPIYRITVHHSGDAEDATGNPRVHLRDIERYHQETKGWACIGYHFVIARDGTIYEARPLKYQGAHATGENNIGNIGICLLGNFDNRPIPSAQRKALEGAIVRLRKQYGIARKDLYGHRDFKITDCPGPYVMAWMRAYKGD